MTFIEFGIMFKLVLAILALKSMIFTVLLVGMMSLLLNSMLKLTIIEPFLKHKHKQIQINNVNHQM